MRRSLIALVSIALFAAACSQDAVETTTTTSTSTTTTTTTTVPETTTTTVDTRPRSPLNGLPVDDATSLERRAIAVKVDNHPSARPQSGIQEADAVFEIRVEGSITRFMGVFHHSDSEYIGPIRSGRPSDATLIRPLEATLFISGAQGWVQSGIREVGVNLFVDTRPGMFRIDGRRAPHNLYGNTVEMRGVADDREIPDTAPPTGLWEFGELPAAAKPVPEVSVRFAGGFITQWKWNPTTKVWERWFEGAPSEWVDIDGNAETISADTLVMIVGRFYTASGGSGSPVPATESVGTGPVYVFSGGQGIEGTWTRENPEDPFVLETLDGKPLPVPPGLPWISLVPDVGEVIVGPAQ